MKFVSSISLVVLVCFVYFLLQYPIPKVSAEVSVFENGWPETTAVFGKSIVNYFTKPEKLAIDSNDNIYIVDSGTRLINKYNTNGGC